MSFKRRVVRRLEPAPPPQGFTQLVLDDPSEESAIDELTRKLVECAVANAPTTDIDRLDALTEDQRARCMRIFIAGMRVSMLGALLMNWDGERAAASIQATLPSMIDDARKRARARRAGH